MPTNITINNVTGTSPYDIYICDNPITICIYITTTSTIPYSFDVPSILDSQNDFTVKIVDNKSCVITQIVNV
jgi:hypothetical protein